MPFKNWFWLLALALLLSACASSQTAIPATSTAAQIKPTATIESSPVPEIKPPTDTPPPATQAELEAQPPVPVGCTVVTQQYSPEPTQQSIFPPVSSIDWAIGPETAVVTLVEYGDFQ